MNDATVGPPSRPGLLQLRAIDDLCQRFEAAWRDGGKPRIEDYLADLPGTLWPYGLVELVAQEVDLRRAIGERCEEPEYHERFPDYPREINAAFAMLSDNGPSLKTAPHATGGVHETDRNHARDTCGLRGDLLLAMLAMELDFLSPDQVQLGVYAWSLDRSAPLGEILVRHHVLTLRGRALLEELVLEHLAKHDYSFHKSIAALAADERRRSSFSVGGGIDHLSTIRRLKSLQSSDADARVDAESAEGAQRIAGGRFRVFRELARGGLGQVSLADDVELGRTVAVKEIQPPYADDVTHRERFNLEAEITGGLEHPGIVPVYGRGVFADGRPYYAMRLIRGANLGDAIDTYHRELAKGRDSGWRMLELHKLLRRFIDVCQAVQYAHSRGVVHRDIKPANIMIGAYGETLVVDWGLAKVIGSDEAETLPGEDTLQPRSGGVSRSTQPGSMLGTPAFMSPEQAGSRHDQAGAAADVYSLGATFYYLLTGKPPVTGNNLDEIIDRVKKGVFPLPREINPRTPRALEAICLKAMANDPRERYRWPRLIIQDIEHWVADEKVSAYRETRGERLARWMRRHRSQVQAAMAVLVISVVVLCVATIVVTAAWRSEKAAKAMADRNKREAVTRFGQARDAVDAWLTGAGHALGYYPGLQKPRAQLLELAARDYERFTSSECGDPDLELERARTLLRLGHLRRELADMQGAMKAVQQSRRILTQLARRRSTDLECQAEIANCTVSEGVLCADTDDAGRAEQLFQQSASQLEDLLRANLHDARLRASLIAALNHWGELLLKTQQLREAEAILRRAVEIARQRETQRVDEAGMMIGIARSKELLGLSCHRLGHYEEAVAWLNAAVEESNRAGQKMAADPRIADARAVTRVSLAVSLQAMGRLEETIDAHLAAVSDYDTLSRILPDVPKFTESQAVARVNLAVLWRQLGQTHDAYEELVAAQQSLERLVVSSPDSPRHVERWAWCRRISGEVLRDMGRLADSRTALEEAIRTYERLITAARQSSPPVVDCYQVDLGLCQSHLGQTLQLLGEFASSESAFASSIEAITPQATTPEVRDQLAHVHLHRGELFQQLGRSEESRRDFEAAAKIWGALAAAPDAAEEHVYHLAWFLANGAEPALRDPGRAVSLSRGLVDRVPGNPIYWRCQAMALYRTGDWSGASQSLDEAIRRKRVDDGRDWLLMAMTSWKTGQAEVARNAFDRATRWVDARMTGSAETTRLRREAECLRDERETLDDARGSP